MFSHYREKTISRSELWFCFAVPDRRISYRLKKLAESFRDPYVLFISSSTHGMHKMASVAGQVLLSPCFALVLLAYHSSLLSQERGIPPLLLCSSIGACFALLLLSSLSTSPLPSFLP